MNDADVDRPRKRLRTGPSRALASIRVHVVQAKLDEQALAELFSLADAHAGAVCAEPADADVIVTAIRMRQRLERHVPWELAHAKALVTPQWLRDSAAHGGPLPCVEYAAIGELRAATEDNCPSCGCGGHETGDEEEGSGEDDDERVFLAARRKRRRKACGECECECAGEDVEPAAQLPLPGVHVDFTEGVHTPAEQQTGKVLPTPPSTPHPSHIIDLTTPPATPLPPLLRPGKTPAVFTPPSSTHATPSKPQAKRPPRHLLPPDPPLTTNLEALSPGAPYAVQRASPLVCANQALAEELNVLRRLRALEGEARSELSYMRAIGTIKAQPHKIKSRADYEHLPHIGPKLVRLIAEYLKRGTIAEVENTKASERFRALSLFASVYGIGPTTARTLWNRGVRTLRDLQRWYDAPVDGEPGSANVEGIAGPDEDGKEGMIRAALGFREDLEIKIPRDEAEEMAAVVNAELDALEPGCVTAVVGGYRRGKPFSNDIDIVITHPDVARFEGLCKRLVQRLFDRGLVTYIIHYSSARHTLDPREHHFDSLEKALAIFVFPMDSPRAAAQRATHGHVLRRRLDLIFARPEQYWTAVVGWSGSTLFQRDLRLWAKVEKGMKFDSSGMTRRRDTKIFYPKTEAEVFQLLGLEYIEPKWRNADV